MFLFTFHCVCGFKTNIGCEFFLFVALAQHFFNELVVNSFRFFREKKKSKHTVHIKKGGWVSLFSGEKIKILSVRFHSRYNYQWPLRYWLKGNNHCPWLTGCTRTCLAFTAVGVHLWSIFSISAPRTLQPVSLQPACMVVWGYSDSGEGVCMCLCSTPRIFCWLIPFVCWDFEQLPIPPSYQHPLAHYHISSYHPKTQQLCIPSTAESVIKILNDLSSGTGEISLVTRFQLKFEPFEATLWAQQSSKLFSHAALYPCSSHLLSLTLITLWKSMLKILLQINCTCNSFIHRDSHFIIEGNQVGQGWFDLHELFVGWFQSSFHVFHVPEIGTICSRTDQVLVLQVFPLSFLN